MNSDCVIGRIPKSDGEKKLRLPRAGETWAFTLQPDGAYVPTALVSDTVYRRTFRRDSRGYLSARTERATYVMNRGTPEAVCQEGTYRCREVLSFGTGEPLIVGSYVRGGRMIPIIPVVIIERVKEEAEVEPLVLSLGHAGAATEPVLSDAVATMLKEQLSGAESAETPAPEVVTVAPIVPVLNGGIIADNDRPGPRVRRAKTALAVVE